METLKDLPKERIREEFERIFLKSKRPSVGLEYLWKLGYFKKYFPEFKDLETTPQHPDHHPEGDVWTHTKLAVDCMADLLYNFEISDKEKMILFYGILCHDLGKPLTTEIDEDGVVRSYEHDEAGVGPTTSFLVKMGVDNDTLKKVPMLVRYHLHPIFLYNQKAKKGAFRRLVRKMYPATHSELCLIAMADKGGRGVVPDWDFVDYYQNNMKEVFLKEEKPKSIISGKELIGLGFKPGPEMGKIVRLCDELYEVHEISKEEILRMLNL